MKPAAYSPPPVIAPGHTFVSVTDQIAAIVLTRRHPYSWFVGAAVGFLMTMMLLMALTYLLVKGTGIWGINIPIGWGFAIINFVWWIGIGHAGTLISAILLLLKQDWRTSINRFAEAHDDSSPCMCAAIFPLVHTGRPWLALYWLFPYPNSMGVWPQFRSPLIWDVFAVSTYFTVSLLFWYTGLIPDLATLRDRAKNIWVARLFGVLALGWRGSARHWARYEMAYLLLAGLSTPLVLSVHTVVSFDFAIGIVPGWHATIFPPYFVAGAIYAGLRDGADAGDPDRGCSYGLEDFITMRHLENMAKVMLVTGLIVAYGYVMEAFFGFYSANKYEGFMILNRMTGPYAPFYWALIFCNIITPQTLWLKKVRTTPILLFMVAMVVNVGMWLERFVIVVTSLHRDFLPSSWGMYWPTRWDWMTFFGTIGLFVMLFFLFIRVLPMISIFEMRTIVPEAKIEGIRGALSRAMDKMRSTALMAEFDDPTSLVAAAKRTQARPAIVDTTRTRRSDSRAVRRHGLSRSTRVVHRPARRHPGRVDGIRAPIVGLRRGLPAERRWSPVHQLADVHSGDVRAHDPFRRAFGDGSVDRVERLSTALPSGVQRRAVPIEGQRGRVFPGDRVRRSEVRSEGHLRVPEGSRAERGQ